MSSVVPMLVPDADDPLAGASPEEIVACARLLAASIADHRARFGAIPLTESLETLRRQAAASEPEPALGRGAADAIAEAMGVLRKPSKPELRPVEAPAPQEPVEAGAERRRQLRIAVRVPVQILSVDRATEERATLRNISWGGAAVQCDTMPGGVGDRVRLLLPTAPKEFIDIVATILRESEFNGTREYGLRFEELTPADEERLEKVLRVLLESPGNDDGRSEARLVQRLEVEYGDAGELRATLEDVSASGLMLTVPDPLELDQSLLISLSSADTPLSLNLRARVVHQTPVGNGDFVMHRVGLEFEHPTPELRERIEAVIRELAIHRPPEADSLAIEADPEPPAEEPGEPAAD